MRNRTRVFLELRFFVILTKHETILGYFRSRTTAVPQVMFLLFACRSKMKGANIKTFGAAFYE